MTDDPLTGLHEFVAMLAAKVNPYSRARAIAATLLHKSRIRGRKIMQNATSKLPAIADDGFNKTDEDNRLIRGPILRFVDGVWKDGDGNVIPPGTRLMPWTSTECLQRWEAKQPAECIMKEPGKPLPDVDELNRQIPQKEWEKGLDGTPRPPWARQQVVYLLDVETGGELTFISGTTGAAIAVEGLRNKIGNMRVLRGARVAPIVTLGSKLMTTKFGSRLRPEFIVQEWRDLNSPTPAAITHEAGKKIEPPDLKEEMNDEIGF